MNRSVSVGRFEEKTGLDPIVVGILAFFVGHMAIRLFGTSNFSVDETMTAIQTQRFQLVYALRNPPMFDWLYFGLSRVLGDSLLTMQILKTALLAGGAVFFYLAVETHLRHRVAVAAVMASYGATAFYGWEILQLYSHTNALIFAMGFTFWAFMRVVGSRRMTDYILLGVGLGFGMLSKYLFGLFFSALVLAALRSPHHRSAMLSPRLLLTLVTGLLMLSPLLHGLSGSLDQVLFSIDGRVRGDASGGMWLPLAEFAMQSAQFWLPFAGILWASLARWPPSTAARADAGGNVIDGQGDENFYMLVRDATVIMVAVTLAAVLIFGTRITHGHYLVPVLSLLPAAIFAGIERRHPFPEIALKKYVQGTVALMVGVALVRFLLFLFAAPPFCVPRCILFVDYAPALEHIDRSDGKQNVILSNDIHIASNMLSALPSARVIVPNEAGGPGIGLADADERHCDLVWFRTYRGQTERSLESALRQVLGRAPTQSELATIAPVKYIKADWQTKLLWDWGPDTIIGIATIDSASALCEDAGRS